MISEQEFIKPPVTNIADLEVPSITQDQVQPSNVPVIMQSENTSQSPANTYSETDVTTPINDDSINEAQSLFDLANAYVSMGDKEEAIEKLQEVITKGSPKLRRQAQDLLDTLR